MFKTIRIDNHKSSLIYICLLIVLANFIFGCASIKQVRTCDKIYIGDEVVRIKKITAGDGTLCFFNMHENENTSVKVAKKNLRRSPGILFYLKHGGSRNIQFLLGRQHFEFDPNRIFTDEGIKKTLSRHGAYTLDAHQAVVALANELLTTVDVQNQHIMIAMHNNGEDDYSSSSYLPGQRYAVDAAMIHQNLAIDHDDFFFVTDSSWYHALSMLDFNVILQNNEQGTDDGSLSIYCGQRNIPYVNIEAQHGHKKEQALMLLALRRVISAALD